MGPNRNSQVDTPCGRIAVVFLHPACNMTCAFCATESDIQSMDFDQALLLLDVIRARSIGNIVLGGGEPFAWDHDVVALAKEAKRSGLFVQVGTNGIALPEGYDTLECFDRYVLPLDGADEEGHNAVRITANGHYNVILDRLEHLRRAGKPVTVSTVVTARNIGQLPRICAFLTGFKDRGGPLHAWHLYKFLPIGRGGREQADALSVSDEAYGRACAAIKPPAPKFAIYQRKDMRHSRSVDFFWYERGALRIGSEVWGCAAPRT